MWTGNGRPWNEFATIAVNTDLANQNVAADEALLCTLQVVGMTLGTLDQFIHRPLVGLLDHLPPLGIVVITWHVLLELSVVVLFDLPRNSLWFVGIFIPVPHVHVSFPWHSDATVSLIELVYGALVGISVRLCWLEGAVSPQEGDDSLPLFAAALEILL